MIPTTPTQVAKPALPDVVGRQSSPEERQQREDLLRLWFQLDSEYTSGEWQSTHLDIIDYIQPNRGAFWPSETNRGTRKDSRIINNTAQDRSRKLAAAMDTGITSEAREWFIVSVEDQRAAEDRGVREYCHALQRALYAFISRIGFYAPNRNVLEDLIGPAIGLMLIEEDAKNTARCTHIPVGQYRVWADSAGEICGTARRFIYTASQMVQEFGEDKVSLAVKNAIAQQQSEKAKFTVLHIIRERYRRDSSKIDAKNKPWESVWLEVGQGYTMAGGSMYGDPSSTDATGPIGLLRESGYDERPFYCPRWDQIGQNAYGTGSPGWVTLGDAISIQDLELGEATTFAKIMDPALNVPEGLSNASLLPGARNPLPDNAKVHAEPTAEIPAEAMVAADKMIGRYEARISQGMYSDILFLLSADRHAEPRTAEEIRGKKEERLLQLGGVFGRISIELRKAIIRIAAIAHRAGLLPEPPPALVSRGLKLKIDFVNPLVTAQKAIGVTSISQVISVGTAAAQAIKGGFTQLDSRKTMNLVTDMLGAPPDMLFSEEELQQQDAAAAAHQNAQAQGAALPAAASAFKDLSSADPEKLRALLQQFGPNAVAQGSTAGA